MLVHFSLLQHKGRVLEAHVQCILGHIGTDSTALQVGELIFKGNIALPKELFALSDYIYHEHWMDIHMKIGEFFLFILIVNEIGK